MTSLTVGVDIGGTKIAAGVVDAAGVVQERTVVPTPDAAAIPAAVAGAVREVSGDREVGAVGIGAAGFVAADRRTVLVAPNIDWHDAPVAAAVEDLVGAPVVVENDANAAAWAEYRFGAAVGVHDVLMITIGTGVGGGIVTGGRLLRGGHGLAGEVGHITVVPDGHPCGCGRRGCLEQYGSGRALVREARARVARGDAGTDALRAACGGDPAALDGPTVTRLAHDGDAAAAQLFEDLGTWIGVGLAGLAAVLDPGVVVVGGGVAAADAELLDPLRSAFAAALPAAGQRPVPRVVPATLGNAAGLIGAADLARQQG